MYYCYWLKQVPDYIITVLWDNKDKKSEYFFTSYIQYMSSYFIHVTKYAYYSKKYHTIMV